MNLAESLPMEQQRVRALLPTYDSTETECTTIDVRDEIDALRATLASAAPEAVAFPDPVGYLYCGGDYGNELEEWEIVADQAQCDRLNEHYGALGKEAKLPIYVGSLPSAQAAPQQPAPAVCGPCGGCGEDNPAKRCIGCMHSFAAAPKAAPADAEGGGNRRRAGGWIKWEGGECPVAPDAMVRAHLRRGVMTPPCKAWTFDWSHCGGYQDITAYRLCREIDAQGESNGSTSIGADARHPFTAAQRERLYRNRPVNVAADSTLAEWHRTVQFIEAAHGFVARAAKEGNANAGS